ncbi:titin homolog isoform X2 [Chrysoperla carnea]|uniref:titin homolog isoform X2 n=1 Tax=Chrysoperla carnea TaxID=189513 RepID=UPI001D0802A2|nr:titin homolog isoform X2 [Chrysoperla carnea]
MHTQVSQLALEKLKDEPLEVTNLSPIIDLIEAKRNSLTTQLNELNTLEGGTGSVLSSQLDLTNDEKIVILKKLQTHFANISKTEKFDFLNEISTNYNKEEYVANLNSEIEKLTSEMHEINVQKVSVKNTDEKKTLETNEQSVEKKLLHAKIKQLAIAKLCELQEIHEDITEDLKNIETIIPNVLQEQEILIKSEIDYSKPNVQQDFQISQQEELSEMDTLTEQQSNLSKLKEHFTSVIKNEISEIVEELASNYKNKGEQYAEALNSEELQLKDKINDLKLQKYNIELLSDSALDEESTVNYENPSEKVKAIDTEISSNETKLLTSQIKKLAVAKVTNINTQTEKLEDLFEDALLSLPNIIDEEEKLLQAAVKTKAEVLESVQTTKQEEVKDVSIVKQQTVERPDLQEIDSVEAQQKLENIHKLKQYFTNVVANDMSEIVEELISNSKDVNYATELKVDEVQIKGKINYLAKWQTYNLEKLSTIPLDEAEDISQKEGILEKVNTLQQEINLNEAKLLKTQIKIMALAKVDEITDKSKPLEDLFQDALLSIPNVLQEEEQLVYMATKVETPDVKFIPKSKELAAKKNAVKLREQIKNELNSSNEDILKLRQHTTNFNEGEINKIVEEVALNARDGDDYTKRLKTEEKRLKERIKDLKWQRYNLERLSSMSTDKSENQNDILETAKILEHEISYNEGKLMNTQIKKMMIANVAEVIDQTENLTNLFQDVLLNLVTELQNEELISKPTPEIPSTADGSVAATETKEQEQPKPLDEIKSRDEDKSQAIDQITASLDETKAPEHVEKKVAEESTESKVTENKETESVLTEEIEKIADKSQTAKDISSLKSKETKDIVVIEPEKAKEDDTKSTEIISPKEIVEGKLQVLEKMRTDGEKPKETITSKEVTIEKFEKKTAEDEKSKETTTVGQSPLIEKKNVRDEKEEQTISTKECVEEELPIFEKVETGEKETEIISKKETVEEKTKASEMKKTGNEKTKQTQEETKEIDLDQKLQSIAKLKEHFATVTKYEIEEVVEELKSEAKDTAYAEKLEAEEERLKCRIDDLKWQQNYLVRLTKIPSEEFDDVSEKSDIVRKVKKLDREITSNEEKLLGTQIKKLAFAQVKSSNEPSEKLDDLFEDALLNIPNILRAEERILQNPLKPKEDVHVVIESKTTEELQQKLSTGDKLEIIEKDSVTEKSETKLPAVEKSKLEEKVSEKGIDPEMLSKLMQHHATVAKTEMSELANELVSNAQNQNYAEQLDNDEAQLKSKINDLKWQRYNLEKLSDITLENTDDIVKNESVLEKAQILEDEIFLNEVNLLNIQIKKLALAKVSEITYQPEIVEDLFEDALLSFPDILLEQKKFIEDMSQISVTSPEIQKLSEIQQISEKTKELENVIKLKEHIAAATKDEIAEIVKELTTETKDDNYANKLKTEDTKLKAKLNDLKWQRYNLEHSIKMRSGQADNRTETDKDSLEKLNILEQEISLNETKLLENQIKIMALGQVAEIKDESENIEALFEDALLTLPNVLIEKENLLSQSMPAVIETSIALQEAKTAIQAELTSEEKKEEVKDKTENEEKTISVEEEKLQEKSVDKKKEKVTKLQKDNETEDKTVITKKEDIGKEKLELKDKEKPEIRSVEKIGDEKEVKTVDKIEKGDDKNQVQSKEVLEEKQERDKATTKTSDDSDDLKEKIVVKEESIKAEKDKVEDKFDEKKEQKIEITAIGNEKQKPAEEKKEKEISEKTLAKTGETADVKLEPKVESKAAEESQELIEDLKKEKIEEKAVDKEEQKVIEEKKKTDILGEEVDQEAVVEKEEQVVESKSVEAEKEKLAKETVEKKEKLTKEKKEEKVADTASKAKDVDRNIEANKGEISEAEDKEILIKLQQYYENMTENEKHEVAKELTINATDEEYCKQLIADEAKLKAKINDLKWQRYNLEKLSNVALEQIDNIPDNDTMLEKLHILAKEITLNEATLQNIQIKKLALAQVAEIVDKSENLEDLFEDCLLNMPSILEEDKIRLVSQPTIISTIISQIQKVKEEQIKVTPLEAIQDDSASLSPEKEIEQKLDSILKLKEYLTSVTQDEVAEIVEELKSNSSNEDYAEQLEIEETQYKANISELKLQKHNLEESSSIIFEKTENIELEDLLLEKANVLEHQITQNEAKLLNTQVKKLALAKVNEIAEICENIEGLIEDVVLSIPAILQEEEHMLQNVIKIETPLVKTEIPVSKVESSLAKTEEFMSKPIEALIESEEQMTTEDIEQLNLHYSSVTSAKIAEFIKEWQSDNDEIAYANRLIAEEKQLTAAINEIKAHKVLLESISTLQNGNSEDLENKRNLEQIAILEQEELLLNNRLKDNQIKKIAIASVYLESNEEEEKVDLLKKIFLNMLNVLKEKSEKLKGKSENDKESDTEEENIKLSEKLFMDSKQEKKEDIEKKEQDLKKQKEATQTENVLEKTESDLKAVEEKLINKDEKLQETKVKDIKSKSDTQSTIDLEVSKEERFLKQETSVSVEDKLEKTVEKEKDTTKDKTVKNDEDTKSESASKTKEKKVGDKDSNDTDKNKQEEILENKKEKLELKKLKSVEENKSENSAKTEEKIADENKAIKKSSAKLKDEKESIEVDSHITQEQKEEVTEKEAEKKSELSESKKLESKKKDEHIADQVIEKKEEKQIEVSIEEEKTKTEQTSIITKDEKSTKLEEKDSKQLDITKKEESKEEEVEKNIEKAKARELLDNKTEVKENKEKTEERQTSIEEKASEQKEKTERTLDEKQKVESINKQQEAQNKLLEKTEEIKLSSETSDEKEKTIQKLTETSKKISESSSDISDKNKEKSDKKTDKKTDKKLSEEVMSTEQKEITDSTKLESNKKTEEKEERKIKTLSEITTEKKGEMKVKTLNEQSEENQVKSSTELAAEEIEKIKDTSLEPINDKNEETKTESLSKSIDEKTEDKKDKLSTKPSVEKIEETKEKTSPEQPAETKEEIGVQSSTGTSGKETKRKSFSEPIDAKKKDQKGKTSPEPAKISDEPIVEKKEDKPTSESTEEKKAETQVKPSSESTEEKKQDEKVGKKTQSSTETEKKEEIKRKSSVETNDLKSSPEPIDTNEETKTKRSAKPTEEKKEVQKVEPSNEPVEEKQSITIAKPTEEKKEAEHTSKPIDKNKEESKVEPSPKPTDESKEKSKSKTSPESTEEKKKEKKEDAKVEQISKPIVENKEESKVEPSSKPIDEKKEKSKAKTPPEPAEEPKVEPALKPTDEKKEKSKFKTSSESTEENKKEKKEDIKVEQTSKPIVENKEESKVEPSPKPTDEKNQKSKAKTSPEPTEEKKEDLKVEPTRKSTHEKKEKSCTEEKKEDAKIEQTSSLVDEKKEETKVEQSPKSTDEKKEKSKAKKSPEPTEEPKVESTPKPTDEKKEKPKTKTSSEPTEEEKEVVPTPKHVDEKKEETKVEPYAKPIIEKKEESKVEPTPKPIDEEEEKLKAKTSPEQKKEVPKLEPTSESVNEKKEETKLESSPKPIEEKKEETKVEPSPKSSPEPTEEKKEEKKIYPEVKSTQKSVDEKKDETIVESSSKLTDKKKEERKAEPSPEPIEERKDKSKAKISPEPTEEKKKETKEDEKIKSPPTPIDEKEEKSKYNASLESTEEIKKEMKEDAKVEPPSKTIDEKKGETIVETKSSPELTEQKEKISKEKTSPELTVGEKDEKEKKLKPSSKSSDIDNDDQKNKSAVDKKAKSPPKPSVKKKDDNKEKKSEVKKDEEKSMSLSKESELKTDKDIKSKSAQDDKFDSKHSKTLDDDKKGDKENTIEKKKESESSVSSKLDEVKSRSEHIKRKESIRLLEKQDKDTKKETVVQKEEISKVDTTNRKIEDTKQIMKDTSRKDSSTYKSTITKKDQQLESSTQEKDTLIKSTDDQIQSYTSTSTYRQISNADVADKKAGIAVGRDRKTTDAYQKDTEISTKRFGAIPKRVEPSKDISRLKVEVPTSNWESRSLALSNRQASPSKHYHKYDNIIKDTEISRSFKNADEIKKGYKTIISDYQTGSKVLKQEKQLLSSLSDYSKSVSLTSATISPKTYSVEPLLFARDKPRSKYNGNLYSHTSSDNSYQALRDTRKTHDRIQNLISLSESVTNSLISTNTITYSDYEKCSRKNRHAIRANLQISKYKPSIDLNYYDGYNRISQINRIMDFEPYYDHYFKLPMMSAVYKSNIERSYLYPRRYEVTLYCGFLRRHETIVRGYNRYKYGGHSYPKIIKHDADESFNLNAVKFSCYENCHSYETCRHQPDARSLVNTTTGKLVLGQKGYMEVCPLRSQHRSVKWRSPDSDKYLKGDAGTDTITTRVRSSLVFVSVKPKARANSDHDIPKIKTLRSCTSTSKHSSYYPRLQKSTTLFISQPDSLISVAPGQDITVSFEINPDSNAKVNWTKRTIDVTRNPRFRTESFGNVTKYILKNSNYDDMGTYCLSAENNYSTSKAFVTVTVDNNCIYKNTTYYKLLKKHNLPSIGSSRTMPTYSKLQDMQLTTYKPTNVITSYSMVPPIFYTLPHNTVAEIGESARFQVTVGGYPSPTVTWTKDGLVIGRNSKNRVIEKFNTKVLEVTLIAAEDAGIYTITVQNEAGRASASARLDIITMKNKPYNLRM